MNSTLRHALVALALTLSSATDVFQSNGVIHVVSRVLLPA